MPCRGAGGRAGVWIGAMILTAAPILGTEPGSRPDPHSFARPQEVRATHLSLTLRADFERRELEGQAELTLERNAPDAPLVLDTRGLRIEAVESRSGEGAFSPAEHELGAADPVLGAPLTIRLAGGHDRVRIRYRTEPGAKALQWVAPEGTTGGRRPFLYTQSQSIHARSWIPCQDSPGVRLTYEAVVRVPPGLQAVMSAEPPVPESPKGGPEAGPAFRFRMPDPIPAYLIALAVGELEFRELGPSTGVWAEPGVVERAAAEFQDTPRMLEAAERRFGPYRWKRYDILVLPPSFPFGGMENARLTFATPTVLAGDRSLVALIAHELAHSWSGNLVSCATWNDFWLNEGFTTYLERRIVEDLFGAEVATMEEVLAYAGLQKAVEGMDERDQTLVGHLDGRDPDDGISSVPYDKGALFLTRIEQLVGRDRFDGFLRAYFDRFAFRSLRTDDFVAFLREKLGDAIAADAERFPLDTWLRGPGLPADAPRARSERFERVDAASKRWQAGTLPLAELPWEGWTTLERVRFVRTLPATIEAGQLEALDRLFHISERANAEVVVPWLQVAIRAGYHGGDSRLQAFLRSVGRLRYVEPLYTALMATPPGAEHARALYREARAGYHPLTVDAVDRIVGATEAARSTR